MRSLRERTVITVAPSAAREGRRVADIDNERLAVFLRAASRPAPRFSRNKNSGQKPPNNAVSGPHFRAFGQNRVIRDETGNRGVLAVRLSAAERGQIAAAADRLELTLSGFVREALEASARVERRVSVVTEPPARLVVVDAEDEPRRHMVDGEWVAGR